MTLTRIRQRIEALDPLVVDSAVAVALAGLVCLQLLVMSSGIGRPAPDGPIPPGAFLVRIHRPPAEAWSYLLAAGSFLPLALRRRLPWLALMLSGACALAYQLLHGPPAFTTLGPMIAIYSVAAYADRRRTWLLWLLASGVIIAVPVFAFSSGTRWIVEVVGAFILVAAAAALGDNARTRREYVAEVENRAREAERTREEEALRRVDEERMRIAREVHDVVAHSLSIVAVQAGAADALIAEEPARAKEAIGHIRSTSKQALAELRGMLEVLRTGESEPLSPSAEITDVEKLADSVRDTGLEVGVRIEGDLAAVPAYASVSAYRIVQEALTNAVRHSKGQRAEVHVAAGERTLRMEISDDGADAADAAAVETGHGIQGMRERVEALGGTFEAGPAPGGGFRVVVSIPIARGAQR